MRGEHDFATVARRASELYGPISEEDVMAICHRAGNTRPPWTPAEESSLEDAAKADEGTFWRRLADRVRKVELLCSRNVLTQASTVIMDGPSAPRVSFSYNGRK